MTFALRLDMFGLRYSLLVAVAVDAMVIGSLAGCSGSSSRVMEASAGTNAEGPTSQPILSTFEDLANTRFAPIKGDPYQPLHAVKIAIPKVEGGTAVWGATGRDQQ